MKRLKGKFLDAILDAKDVEIDQKADFDAGKLHVCQELSFMYWKQVFYGLQFKNNIVFNPNISTGKIFSILRVSSCPSW